jgi:Domain of unknown function (DUF1992)
MPLDAFDSLIDQQVRAAIARGEFDNLPGAGKPLALDDDAHLPEELRMSFRILKNAGYLPPELQDVQDLQQLEAQVFRDQGSDSDDNGEAASRRATLKLRLLAEAMRGDTLALQQYRQLLLDRLQRGHTD